MIGNRLTVPYFYNYFSTLLSFVTFFRNVTDQANYFNSRRMFQPTYNNASQDIW